MMFKNIEDIKNSRLTIISYNILSDLLINDFIINILQPDIILNDDEDVHQNDVLEKLKSTYDKRIYLQIPLTFLISQSAPNPERFRDFIRVSKIICEENNNQFIILNTVYKVPTNTGTIYTMSGGDSIAYECDVLFVVIDNILKCIKNRFGKEFEVNLKDLRKTIRKLKLNKIDGKISNRN